jgi:hypothetical protein
MLIRSGHDSSFVEVTYGKKPACGDRILKNAGPKEGCYCKGDFFG